MSVGVLGLEKIQNSNKIFSIPGKYKIEEMKINKKFESQYNQIK